jgi:membrane fusion protein, multidrug efflux system
MSRTLIWILVLALLVGAGAWSYRHNATAKPATVAAQAAAAAAVSAPVLDFGASDLALVTPGRLSRSIPLTGTLRPVNQVVVRSKVGGEVRELLVREGMPVRRGQLVARIDASEFELRVREREAQLKSVESQVVQARRTLDNTQALQARNFVSQSALDAARSSWEVAAANRDAAAAQLTLARKTLADATLSAPMDGIVAERFAQPGEKIAIDARIVSIIDLSMMEIEAPVPAAEIGSIKVGQPVSLQIEGVAQQQVGTIARIAPTTQAGTRSVPVYIALANRDPTVRAGLFAQGRLIVDSRDDVLNIPASAVRDAGGRTFVYAIVDGRLTERDVLLGMRDDSVRTANGNIGVVEVRAGLAAGDRIVAANLGALRPGSMVRIAPPPAAQARP